MINSFDLLFSTYKSYIKYNNNELQKLMIKSTLKHILVVICLVLFISCDTEDIIEDLTGTEIFWLCQNSNILFADADICNSVCSIDCLGYEENDIALSWIIYCEELQQSYETIQECITICPNNCEIRN
tara:strand:- start:66 stop:449 length:384 start_codon:yes stop_codon:yes gene_type:complete